MSVDVTKQEHISIFTINRPEARNAINGAVASGLEAAVDAFEEDPDQWVAILTGAGTTFCAGADLKEISSGNAASLMTERGGFGGFVMRERTKPIIAAINGPAVAGGCELTLACDMVVAAENAKFGVPEVKRSLVAAAGALFRLPRAVGPALAMEMITTGDPIDAQRAYDAGLVNKVVPEGKALEGALELAARIAANAPLAVQASRNIAVNAMITDDKALWRASGEAFAKIIGTEDASEGPRAFIEKRAPVWKAR